METRTSQLLEFSKVLNALASRTVSEPGAAASLGLIPFNDLDQARHRSLLCRQAMEWVSRSGFKLASFLSLEGMFNFVEREEAVLEQDGLFALGRTLGQFQEARNSLKSIQGPEFEELQQEILSFAWPETMFAALDRCLDDEGRLKDRSSPELLSVRTEIRQLHQRCTRKVKDFILTEDLGRYLQDEFMTLSSDRYVLPFKSTFKTKMAGIIHDYSQTGETCYFEPMFLVELNNRLQELKKEEAEEEQKVLIYLTNIFRKHREDIQRCYDSLVSLDVLLASAALGRDMDGCLVEIVENGAVNLVSARHPMLTLSEVQAVPVDIELKANQKAMIITGGNAGGKTVALKTLGLIALMAFSGLPVPADEGSTIPFWKKIFVIMGDEQSLEDHVSTFTAQIQSLSRVYEEVDSDTLFLLDEFGAGTDPTQGAALAQAVVDRLVNCNATVFAATHFPSLKAYGLADNNIRAASVLFDPSTKKPLFKLAYDQVGASIALDVAREHGLPTDILSKAEKLLLLDGSDTSNVLDRLNSLAVEREKELAAFQNERASFDQKKKKLEHKFNKERRALLEEVRSISHTILEEWRSGKADRKKALKKLAQQRDKIEVQTERKPVKKSSQVIVSGTNVRYALWDKTGVVLEKDERKKRSKVDFNGVAMWVKTDDLECVSGSPSATTKPKVKDSGPSEMCLNIDVRGQRADVAVAEVERFIDQALLRGAGKVEVVHGRGTGALRREVHVLLGNHPAVSDFTVADEDHGGDGKTEITLK